MVKLAVVALMLGACIAEDATTLDRDMPVEAELAAEENQVCALAAALPESELCSAVCDPDEFAARLVAGGMKGGSCYQIRCTLSPEMTVSVGICLP